MRDLRVLRTVRPLREAQSLEAPHAIRPGPTARRSEALRHVQQVRAAHRRDQTREQRHVARRARRSRSDHIPGVRLRVVVNCVYGSPRVYGVALWRLTPRNAPQNLDAWRHSTYWGPAIIRAADETAARGIAQRAFLEIADTKSPRQEIRFSPWLQARLVACSRMAATAELAEDGAPGIVAPHQAVAVAHREQ